MEREGALFEANVVEHQRATCVDEKKEAKSVCLVERKVFNVGEPMRYSVTRLHFMSISAVFPFRSGALPPIFKNAKITKSWLLALSLNPASEDGGS